MQQVDSRKITPATRQRILSLVSTTDGSRRSLSEIARLVGCNRKTVREILRTGKQNMPLPTIDPNECIDQVTSDVTAWLSKGNVPNLVDAAGHGATVLGSLLHNHGVGTFGGKVDIAKLKALGSALGVEPPAEDDEGVGGPFVNLFVSAIIAKLGPIVMAWILKFIEQTT